MNQILRPLARSHRLFSGALLFALAGCVAPIESETAVDGADPTAPEAAAPEADLRGAAEVASQTLEIEPGHVVTFRRFADGSLSISEQGTIGVHQEAIGADDAVRSPASIAARLVPGVALDPVIARTAPRAGGGVHVMKAPLSPYPPPSSPALPEVGSIGASSTDLALLHCAGTSVTPEAVSATACLTGVTSGTAILSWDSAGWYRAFSYNRSTTNATARILRWTASGWVTNTWVTMTPGQWSSQMFLSATKDYLHAQVTNVAGTGPIGLSALVTQVSPRYQQESNWCWAATSSMLMASLGENYQQCELANAHWGRTDCCNTPSPCNGRAEVIQALTENGFTGHNMVPAQFADVDELISRVAAGPVAVGIPGHAKVISDYQEKNGVPWVAVIDPWSPGDPTITNHVHWVPFAQINDGTIVGGTGNVHKRGASLGAATPATFWKNNTLTASVEAPGAQSYRVEFINGAGAHNVWASYTRNYNDPTYGDPIDDWGPQYNTVKQPFAIGGWLWYNVRVTPFSGLNGGGTAGASVTTPNRVTLKPTPSITSFTRAGSMLTAVFTANPGPTKFRWRFVNASMAERPPLRASETAATLNGFNTNTASQSFSISLPAGTRVAFELSACNENGCSPFVTSAELTY